MRGMGQCKTTEQCNAIGSAGAMYERLAFVITSPASPGAITADTAAVMSHQAMPIFAMDWRPQKIAWEKTTPERKPAVDILGLRNH